MIVKKEHTEYLEDKSNNLIISCKLRKQEMPNLILSGHGLCKEFVDT